jgi:beta-glucosidase
VSVTNTSPVDGKEVVQIYVQDLIASVVVPNMELKGFKKVAVKAGETMEVSVELDVGKWGVWNKKMEYVVEKGDFVVWVGASSKDLRGNGTVTVF